MEHQGEVLQVSEARWTQAQEWESEVWKQANSKNPSLRLCAKFARALGHPKRLLDYFRFGDFYCGDDWNYWWLEAFDRYRVLPKVIDCALEVGCGPYTNIRLVSKVSRIAEINCVDPLLDSYRSFKGTWLARNLGSERVKGSAAKGEDLPYPDSRFDLVVCINVLDHVQDARACLSEIDRVIKPGGILVFGQDLTDDEDLEEHEEDIGHPILIRGETLNNFLNQGYEGVLRRTLSRESGRNPDAHYGTLIFIGKRK